MITCLKYPGRFENPSLLYLLVKEATVWELASQEELQQHNNISIGGK